jgi:hypothetical protein
MNINFNYFKENITNIKKRNTVIFIVTIFLAVQIGIELQKVSAINQEPIIGVELVKQLQSS